MSAWFAGNLIIIQTVMVYAVLALSFQVVLRAGVFSFASVGFFGLGAYAVAVMTLHGIPGWLALVIALVGAGVLGMLLGFVLRKLRGLYLGLFTIAFDLVLNVLYKNGGTLTGATTGLFGVPEVVPLWGLLLIVLLAVAAVWRLSRGSVGRSSEALRLNEHLARSVGIEVTRRRTFIFAFSAVLGAAAGAMNVSVFTTVSPSSAGFGLVTLGITMVVLGGMASWQGALIGAIFVAWLPAWLGPLQQYQLIVNGLIIVVIVVLAPDGLVGIVSRLVRGTRDRRARESIGATE